MALGHDFRADYRIQQFVRVHQECIRLGGSFRFHKIGVQRLRSPCLAFGTDNLEFAQRRSAFEPDGMQEAYRDGDMLQEAIGVGAVGGQRPVTGLRAKVRV